MPTKTVETFPARRALETMRADLAVLIGLAMLAGLPYIQGDVLGVVTATKEGRRRTRQPATGAGFATTSNTGTVADASVFKPGDVITNAAGTNIGTIAANGVNTGTNAITLTANAAVAVAAGADVLGSDGSQRAAGVSDQSGNGVGTTSNNVFIGGFLKEEWLRGLDATAKQELGGASMAGGVFKF